MLIRTLKHLPGKQNGDEKLSDRHGSEYVELETVKNGTEW